MEALQALVASPTESVAALSNNVTKLKETSANTIIMSESDQKPSATTHSKTKALNLEAPQALVAANAVSVAKLTMHISKIKETSEEINTKLVLEQEVHGEFFVYDATDGITGLVDLDEIDRLCQCIMPSLGCEITTEPKPRLFKSLGDFFPNQTGEEFLDQTCRSLGSVVNIGAGLEPLLRDGSD
eukprot:scaffold87106_cov73-Attheya_sp.AAC.4